MTGTTEPKPGEDNEIGSCAAGSDSEPGGAETGEDRPAGAEEDGSADSGEPEGGALADSLVELEERNLRLHAEFRNYRRRSERERLNAWARAQADLVRGILDALDDLDRVSALELDQASVESIMKGIDLVSEKFARSLADAEVEIIRPEGEVFDPVSMEAVVRVPTESEDDDDRVAMVVQKGYRLGDILIRPARVGVFKK